MKVYTCVVLDMETMEVLHEDSFEYEGSVALCGGSGGSSGKVRYPAYVESVHEDWLRQTSDTIDQSVTDTMNAALGNSPYTSLQAYDPDTDIATFVDAVSSFDDLVDLFSQSTTLDEIIEKPLDDTRLNEDIEAFSDQITSIRDSTIIPAFEAGMRDINAVMSSAFVIGKALLEASISRDITKYGSELRLKYASDDALKVAQMKLEYKKIVAQLMTEAYRIKIVAKKEEADVNAEYEIADAKWDLEVYQYGANVLAGPGGGTAVPSGKKNLPASVIGGALSGAAMGAVAGSVVPGLGTTLGAAAGGLLGIGAGLLG